MPVPAPHTPRWKEAAAYLAALLLCLSFLTWVMELWRADLRVPLAYTSDAVFYQMMVKSIINHGWYLDNPSLSMPTGLNMRDVPISDHNFYLLLLKLGSLLVPNQALLINLLFLLSFPLTTLAALYVLRQFRLSYFPAVFAAVLYTFIPFHFGRGVNHLFLSSYYLIPLIVLLTMWIGTEAMPPSSEQNGWFKLKLRDPKLILSLVVCVLIASTDTYYSYFACFFLLIAGLAVAVRRRSFQPLLLPALLVSVITVTTALNMLPSVIYIAQHGDTPIVRRNVSDAEIYGLRIAQLLLPVSGHRSYRVSQIKGLYNLRPFINENDDAALGIIGSAGFLILLGWLLYRTLGAPRAEENQTHRWLDHLSLLNAAAVLLATIGGFGALFSLFVSPKIRSYNRISVYIAFFSFFAVALLLEDLSQHYFQSEKRQTLFRVALALLLLVGVWDQTSKRFIPDYERLQTEYQQDAEFVHRIEAALPKEAMVFQLPVASFPENPKIQKMNDYDLGKGYLHSRQLRWSYGAIKNREGDVWQRLVAATPASEMAKTLALAGFSGIYLDRFGYADQGAKLEAEFSGALGATPLISPNKRLVFFDLMAYEQHLHAADSAAEWEAKRDAALHPLLTLWQNGFSDTEGTPEKSWRWCADEGRLEIVNHSSQPKEVTLEMTFAAGRDANLQIESALFSERLPINFAGVPFTKKLTLPPGAYPIKFFCDAPRVLAPLDSRVIVFRVENFKLAAAP